MIFAISQPAIHQFRADVPITYFNKPSVYILVLALRVVTMGRWRGDLVGIGGMDQNTNPHQKQGATIGVVKDYLPK